MHHFLHTIVITKYQAIIADQGKNLFQGKFEENPFRGELESFPDQPEEIRVAEAILNIISQGIGEIRVAIPNDEKQVWRVSQLQLKKVMDAIQTNDEAEWGRLKGFKSVSNWMFENETVGKAMVAWGCDMGVVMTDYFQEAPKEDLSWMGTGD